MRTFQDLRMRELLMLALQTRDAVSGEDKPEGARLAKRLIQRTQAVGVESASAWRTLAVAHDYLGELEMAMNAILKSLSLDPLAPSTRNSFDIIARRLREELMRAAPDDAVIPRLYAV